MIEHIRQAWEALRDCTPLKSDCGLLCAAACCAPDEEGKGGVALIPGELELMGDIHWGHIEHDTQMNAPMLVCPAPCDRERRPFLCRIFPLCPCTGKDGRVALRMDARARALCPLARHGLRGLDPAFVRAAASAVRCIASCSEGKAFLERWAAIEEEFRKPLF